MQVKIAEHVLTQHKVAIKILNKRKIKQQDMEEKGVASPTAIDRQRRAGHWLFRLCFLFRMSRAQVVGAEQHVALE